MGLFEEIHEQPEVAGRLLAERWADAQKIAAAIRERDLQFVYLVARGSSDNAGLYAKYLLGVLNGFPVALAVPSLFTKYQSPPKLKKALVIGISQSGESPDIVEAVAEGKRQGATTVVITNSPSSPLAREAEFLFELNAGTERAVAATKTYTGQLLAIAMLAAALSGKEEHRRELEQVPTWIIPTLVLSDSIRSLAQRYRYMDQCVILGRGFNYATAYEWALKLKELTYVIAEPYSSADFRHGPIAIVEKGFPVMVLALEGPCLSDIIELCRHLEHARQAELMLITNSEREVGHPERKLQIPDVPEWISPLISIIPAQLFCFHLTVAKGYDPEHPRGLRKVTETS